MKRRIFVNPEARKITVKYLIVLILGISVIIFSCYRMSMFINEKIISQNIITYASILDGESDIELIKNFNSLPSEEQLKDAEEVLKSYGYDSDMSIESNKIIKIIFNRLMIDFVPIIIAFFTTLYILFMRELKSMYTEIEEVIANTDAMSEGKYKSIDGEEQEGDMAKLICSLNFMGDRVNNSIGLLKADKENLKDFLADISHQLKTPLASLVMFNDLMVENEDMPYEDRKKFLESSAEQLRRMEWLIMNLLKVGRLEANAVRFNIYKQPLRETLEHAISSLLESAKFKNQNLCLTGELDAEVEHDKEWLSEAVSNIVKNAIEHTQVGGKIEVNVSKGPLITKIYIKDNGPGIAKEVQKKVFKRFYKGEDSTNPTSIGIGLSLAKSIVEEQNGEIRLISKEGEGTTFIISFFL